jgi:hypothetical protein
MLVKIIERAREIKAIATEPLLGFLSGSMLLKNEKDQLQHFADLDDVDIMMAVKHWKNHPDPVLSTLCSSLLNRKLLKIQLQSAEITNELFEAKDAILKKSTGWPPEWRKYLVFTGKAENTTYKLEDEKIEILFKNGQVKNISEVDHGIIRQNVAATVGKYYICWQENPH